MASYTDKSDATSINSREKREDGGRENEMFKNR